MSNSKRWIVPPAETNIFTVEAEPWIQISEEGLQLEGLCFDRTGNLYFVEVFGGSVMKLDVKSMKIKTIAAFPKMNPAAVKIHKDGRLFIACLGDFRRGGVLACDPENSDKHRWIIAPDRGYVVDDLVFDSDGGFYFTDFKGKSTEPDGGIYYCDPNGNITKILGNMAVPNGIALTPQENALWVTEMSNNRLHYIELEKDRITIPAFGTSVPYHFSGFSGPDSCCIDACGNLYVAMYQQGRFLIFNPSGIPFKQIVLPGWKEGHMLRSTHPMIMPETDEVILCSNDGDGGRGSWLYRAKAEAGTHRYFQFKI